MLNKIILGVGMLAAVVHGVVPDIVPNNILPLALVLLGLVYGVTAIDSENATDFLVLVVAVIAVSQSDLLSHIHVIGGHLDAIWDAYALPVGGAVVPIALYRVYHRLVGGGGGAESDAA